MFVYIATKLPLFLVQTVGSSLFFNEVNICTYEVRFSCCVLVVAGRLELLRTTIFVENLDAAVSAEFSVWLSKPVS